MGDVSATIATERRRDGRVPAGVGRDRSRRGARQRARTARALARPPELLAVVKADGYGHGAVPVAAAALEAGAVGLGVALVEEGIELRDAGHRRADPRAVGARTRGGAERRALTGSRRSCTRSTGSTRSPRPSPIAAPAIGSGCTSRSTPACTASGAGPTTRWSSRSRSSTGPSSSSRGCVRTSPSPTSPRTPTPPSSSRASARCSRVFRARGICRPAAVHACNTAGAIDWPDARFDMVRVGIGCYGIAPADALEGRVALQPAMSVKARVSQVKAVPGGCARLVRFRYETDARDPHRDRAHRLRRRRAARASRITAARRSSVVGGARSRERSRWTSSCSTSATSRSRSATKSC